MLREILMFSLHSIILYPLITNLYSYNALTTMERLGLDMKGLLYRPKLQMTLLHRV
jgi:hypothetical protein